MQFHFGAQVQQSNGDRLGELTRVVYNPENRDLDFLVAQSARLGERELKIPLECVETTADDMVQLRLTEEEFEELEEYSLAHNIAPPPDRDFADIDDEDEPAPGAVAPPVGAATGIESIAFIPIVEEELYIPIGDGVIDRSTEVWAIDGLVGHARGVGTEDLSPIIQEIVARASGFFTHDVYVPARYVETVRTDAIVLNVDRAAVDAQQAE